MSDQEQIELDARRRRLRYRAWHRGIVEMDMLLGHFADSHIVQFDESQLHRFELLLNQPDPDLYAWYCRRRTLPEHQQNDVTDLFLNFRLPS